MRSPLAGQAIRLLAVLVGANVPPIRKESEMLSIPSAAEPLVKGFLPAFTRRTSVRMTLLVVGRILVMGRRTVPQCSGRCGD